MVVVYERELELAAAGKPHQPIEVLWLLHVSGWWPRKRGERYVLSNAEVAEVLNLGGYRDDALKAVRERLARARRWWTAQVAAHTDALRRLGRDERAAALEREWLAPPADSSGG